jgi:hypothetical protein
VLKTCEFVKYSSTSATLKYGTKRGRPRYCGLTTSLSTYARADRRTQVQPGRQGRSAEAGPAGRCRCAGRGRQGAAAASAQQQAVTTTPQPSPRCRPPSLTSRAIRLRWPTVSDETAKIKKDIANPSVLHYKGITLTPGGFAAAETVYRSKATGGDIPTAFNAFLMRAQTPISSASSTAAPPVARQH